ncbi:MAG: protein-glutamate O-methyltransferase CheR [Candidatus Tectimicrobiota bacterium]
MLTTPTMTRNEFQQFQRFVSQIAGIHLSDAKMPLVSGRLSPRLRHYQCTSYSDYLRLLHGPQGAAEVQVAVDLLTTHETAFFREPQHFTCLRDTILPARQADRPFRVWSAACSTGEEPYTIAMVLADSLREHPWEILASDISTGSVARAQAGHYAMERAAHIPTAYLSAYCLKGIGRQAGTFLIGDVLRRHIRFTAINLNAPLPQMEPFDIVFIRNVMIYFDTPTKAQVIQRVTTMVRPGGYVFIGHSETLHGLNSPLQLIRPGMYCLV